MARIKIDLPNEYLFSTVLPVRINDINYGGHLSNDAVLSMVHEARLQFLKSHGYTELDVEGMSLIMNDAAVVYKSEGFHADQIEIQIALTDFHKYGCDVVYLLSNQASGAEVAHVKTGVMFFDYEARKVKHIPEAFKQKFSQ